MPRRRVPHTTSLHTTSLKERIAERAKAIATKAGTFPLGSKERDRMERRARQASTGSDNPVMIRYHVSGGHSGGEPLKVQVNNSAESLAFLMWQLR